MSNSLPTKEKYLIIGAGPVGLGYAKALKEAEMPYDHIDASTEVGGNWFHGTYETAHIISSRKITEYSDYPMPKHYPDFPSKQMMLDYYIDYANTFGLRERVEFQRKVIYIRPIENDRWEVTFANQEVRIYKAVLVCNGHHWCKRFPEYPGKFTGEFIHSKDYKRPDQLIGKRVLVIGAGNSACDIASEAARVSKSSHISMRSGAWFFPKTVFGRPLADLSESVKVPLFVQRIILRFLLKMSVGTYKDYGLPKPNYKIFERHPTISSEVLHYMKHGRITYKPAIKRLDGKTVEFVDGSKGEFDMIVAATGYHVSYPFLPDELQRVEGPVVKVYGGSMLDTYKGLYLIGWAQPRGGVGSLVAPSSKLMAKLIKLQDEMQNPLGFVLKQSGDKLPTTHLFDPNDLFKRIRQANKRIGLLRSFSKRVDKKHPNFQNTPLPPPPESIFEKEMVVF